VNTALANLRHLLELYRSKQRTDDFIRLAERYVEASKRTRGAAPSELQMELGKYYVNEFQLEEAERHLSDALATLEAAKEPDEESIIGVLNDLGQLRLKQQRFDEAEAYFLRGREFAETRDPESRNTALAINNLAWFYVERERYEEAITLAQQSKDILDSLELSKWKKVGVVDTLAWASAQSGQWSEALSLYREVLGDYSEARAAPRIRLELSEVYDHYKTVLRATGNGEEATLLERRLVRAEELAAVQDQRAKQARAKARREGRATGSRYDDGSDDEELLDEYESDGLEDSLDAPRYEAGWGDHQSDSDWSEAESDSNLGDTYGDSADASDDFDMDAGDSGVADDSGYGPNEQVRRLPEPDTADRITPIGVETPGIVRDSMRDRDQTPSAAWDDDMRE
jgi:tetratricopeptide (TPR) repeat protein